MQTVGRKHRINLTMKNFFLIYLLISGSTLTAQRSDVVGAERFIDIAMTNYFLKCPHSWMVDSSRVLGIDLLLRSPRADSLDQFIENMNVFVQNLKGQNYDLLRMGRESELQIKNMATNVEILDSRLDSSSSTRCYILKYRSRQGKFILISHQRYYLKNEIGIALTFTVENAKEEEYKSISASIFESFRWN
jgi:hypothetical protein